MLFCIMLHLLVRWLLSGRAYGTTRHPSWGNLPSLAVGVSQATL